MFTKIEPFFIHVFTPLHAGSGDDLGSVDLPIQREKHTGFPKIESSSLKGAFRHAFDDIKEPEIGISDTLKRITKKSINLVFGLDSSVNPIDQAGILGFTDARLLLFPVKSMKGIFAWITCPMVLERFNRDLLMDKSISQKNKKWRTFNEINDFKELKGTITNQAEICIDTENKKVVILEEYTFTVNESEPTTQIADFLIKQLNISGLKTKFIILSDDDFKDFVTLSTEVITRTKIDPETGTVDKKTGALFTEEYLPAESILYSFVMASPLHNNGKINEENIVEFFKNGFQQNQCNYCFQIGGNATIGKGFTEIKFFNTLEGQK